MGHTHIREYQVVDTKGPGLVHVEAAQVSIDPVHTPGPCGHTQIRRNHTKPLLSIRRFHGDGHGVTNILCIEHQVLLDLIIGQAQITSHAVVALVLG